MADPIVPGPTDFDVYRVDAQQRICDNTLEVFRRNTVMRGIQTAQAAESQQLLDAFVDLWGIRTLDEAQEYYLDVIGRIVGLWPRPRVDAAGIIYFGPDSDQTPPDWVPVYVTNAPTSGTVPMGDADYRTQIRARIIKNHVKYGSAPEIMYFAMFAFGMPVSVRNVGLADLEVVLPASAPPALVESIIAEVSDETADHKYTLPIPVTGRIIRVFFRYPDAFAPDVDSGAPDVARIGVAHYVVNP